MFVWFVPLESGSLNSYIVKVSYIAIFMSQWDFIQPVSGPLPVESWEPCVPQPSIFSGPSLRCLCVEVVTDGRKTTLLWAILTPLLPSNHSKAWSLLPGGSGVSGFKMFTVALPPPGISTFCRLLPQVPSTTSYYKSISISHLHIVSSLHFIEIF